jgi:predicted MFS family arabinose efflux permease
LLPLPRSPLPLAVLTVVALGGPLSACAMPAISIMTDAIERIGAALALGTMLFNLAWATGETIGAPAAASVSRATSDAVPLVALAVVMLVTLAISLRAARRWPRPAVGPPASRRGSHSR